MASQCVAALTVITSVLIWPSLLIEGSIWTMCTGNTRDMAFFQTGGRKTWSAAEVDCQAQGGHLATILNSAHFLCATDAIGVHMDGCRSSGCGHIWTGLHRQNSVGTFHWVGDFNRVQSITDTSPASPWWQGEPVSLDGHDCVQWTPAFLLGAEKCSETNSYLCERTTGQDRVSVECQQLTYTYHTVAVNFSSAVSTCNRLNQDLMSTSDPVSCRNTLFGDTRLADARTLPVWARCSGNHVQSQCAAVPDENSVEWSVLDNLPSVPRPFICKERSTTTPTPHVPMATNTIPHKSTPAASTMSGTSPIPSIPAETTYHPTSTASPTANSPTNVPEVPVTKTLTSFNSRSTIKQSTSTTFAPKTSSSTQHDFKPSAQPSSSAKPPSSSMAVDPNPTTKSIPPLPIQTPSQHPGQNHSASQIHMATQSTSQHSGTTKSQTRVSSGQVFIRQSMLSMVAITEGDISAVGGAAPIAIILGIVMGVLAVGILIMVIVIIKRPTLRKRSSRQRLGTDWSVGSAESNHYFRPDPCVCLGPVGKHGRGVRLPVDERAYENVRRNQPEPEVQYAVPTPVKQNGGNIAEIVQYAELQLVDCPTQNGEPPKICGKKEPPTVYAELDHVTGEMCRSVSR